MSSLEFLCLKIYVWKWNRIFLSVFLVSLSKLIVRIVHTLVIPPLPPSLTLFMKSKVWAEGKSFVNNPLLYDWKFVNCSIPPSTDQHSCKIYFMRSQVSTEGVGERWGGHYNCVISANMYYWGFPTPPQHGLVILSIND